MCSPSTVLSLRLVLISIGPVKPLARRSRNASRVSMLTPVSFMFALKNQFRSRVITLARASVCAFAPEHRRRMLKSDFTIRLNRNEHGGIRCVLHASYVFLAAIDFVFRTLCHLLFPHSRIYRF